MEKLMRAFLIVMVFSMTAYGQQKLDSIQTAYSKSIHEQMLKKKITGASIAIINKDGIVWSEHFGYADKEQQIKPDNATLYGIGSVSKVFTAAAIMQLNEQNKLSIDKPLQTYLPELSIKGTHVDEITARNVMTHHSGLPSDVFKGMFTNKPEHYTATVGYINKEYMAEQPNTIRAYSNPGFSLLGHTIHNVSGMEYGDYLKANIFEPLQMNASGLNLRDQSSKTYDGEGLQKEDVLMRDTPAGGVYTSVEDLSKFVKAYLNKSDVLFNEATYNEIFSVQNQESPLDLGSKYALSFNMTSRPHTGPVYTHTGTTLYYNAALSMAPEVGLAVVLLTNSEKGGALFENVNSLLEDVAEDSGLPEVEPTVESVEAAYHVDKVTVDPQILAQYSGVYAVPGGLIKVYMKRKMLYMKLQGIKMMLVPVAENEFIPKPIIAGIIRFKLKETRMYFDEIDGKKLLLSADTGSSKDLLAAEMKINPIPAIWDEQLGDYKISDKLDGEIDFFTDFKLVKDGEIISLAFKQVNNGQKIKMALEMIDEKRAKVAGIGRYAGQSVLINEYHVQAFGLTLNKIN